MSDDERAVSDDPDPTDEAAEAGAIEPGAVEPGAAGATEPAAPTVAGTPSRRRISWSKMSAFGILPVVVLLLAAAAGFLTWRQYTLSNAQTAAAESVRVAKDSTIAMLSYEPDTAEDQLVAARDRLTGDFLDEYTVLTDTRVIPVAKEQQVRAEATVPTAASVSADADHAVVLVFVDQMVMVGTEVPSATKSSVRVTLDKIDGEWLISDFQAV